MNTRGRPCGLYGSVNLINLDINNWSFFVTHFPCVQHFLRLVSLLRKLRQFNLSYKSIFFELRQGQVIHWQQEQPWARCQCGLSLSTLTPPVSSSPCACSLLLFSVTFSLINQCFLREQGDGRMSYQCWNCYNARMINGARADFHWEGPTGNISTDILIYFCSFFWNR